MTPRGFSSQAEFRAWLERNHGTTTELLLRLSKVQAKGGGLTYRQALDEALCHGWIDGVRRRLDDISFSQRFSPRKPKSAWSTVNIKRFRELEAEGRVATRGAQGVRGARQEPLLLREQAARAEPGAAASLSARPKAWRFFSATPPWYQRTCSFYVMSAKQPETRERRLGVLISHCERGQALPPMKLPATRAGSKRKKATAR